MMRLSDYVMKRLSDAGIGHVFHVTGRGALFLSDALAKSDSLVGISMHHEQACAFAAISYAEQTENVGACLVSTGCASTNAVTGVLSAWQDGIPCIFISGQNTLHETTRFTNLRIRTYGQQEADIISIVKPITKFSAMLTSPQDIVAVMDKAIHEAQSGRMGPVWIDIPIDLQSAKVNPDNPVNLEPSIGNKTCEALIDKQISPVIDKLKSSKRPVVLIGRGVRASKAEKKLIDFVEALKIPLTFTASAPDTFGTENLLSIGSVGSMGCSRAGNFAVQNSDFVLVLGSRLTSLNTGVDFCKFAREAIVAVVDIDPIEHSKDTIKIDYFIEADIGQFLDKISSIELSQNNGEWVEKCIRWKTVFSKLEPEFASKDKVDLYQLSEAIGNTAPRPISIITDSGLNEVILPTNIRFGSNMRCIHPASQGAMGYALPAAVGAQVASNSMILAVIGDGSIMMNLQELETIRNLQLPIKIIVINNNVYSIIRRRQKDLFRNRTIGTDPNNGVSCPDFSKVANCFGLNYLKIEKVDDLNHGLREFFAISGPALCEIMGRVDQSYIEVSHARSELNNRIVRRPLEDQSPFLSRDIFLKEMMVKPIDQ